MPEPYSGDSALCKIYFDIMVPSTSVLAIILMLPALHRYLKLKSDPKVNKYLFWICWTFFIIIFLYLLILIPRGIFFCHNHNTFQVMANISSQLYGIQTVLLSAIFFLRLYFIFAETTFALSQAIIIIYWIIFCLCTSLFIAASIAFSNFSHRFIAPIIIGIAFSMFLITISILIILFLYKLTQVHTSVDQENSDPALIEVITKTSILASISTIISLLNAIAIILEVLPSTTSIHTIFISKLFNVYDVITNFWCVILSFSGYTDWYLKVCKRCDSICISCWHSIVGLMSEQQTRLRPKIRMSESDAVKQQQIAQSYDE